MPGNPPSVNTEREALVAYLVQQRDGLKYAAYGLTEQQARARPTVSALSVAGLHKVRLPAAPWYPEDPEGFSARWILLHVLEELARHAGHADIIREHIDGATMYELMAAAEGWPEADWLKPWRPKVDGDSAGSNVDEDAGS